MRRGSGVRLAVAVLLLVLGAADLRGAAGPSGTFSLTERRADGWTFDVRPRPPVPTYVSIEGIPHLLFAETLPLSDILEGSPLVPSQTLSIGIPPGARISATLLDPVYETLSRQRLAPRPRARIDASGEAVLSYEKDAAVYGQNRFLPDVICSVESTFTFRRQQIATVRVATMRFNPSRHELQRLTSARLEIRLTPGPGAAPEAGYVSDPECEGLYRTLLDNYDEARAYRLLERGPLAPADTTGSWFERGLTYYRIPVARDGWYRLNEEDLARAGATLSAVEPARVRIYRDGHQIPVRFHPDSSIEFYGQMKRGVRTYADPYSDTSSYWLTWGGSGSALNYQGLGSAPAPEDTLIESAPVTRHYEENTDYYEGTGYTEVIDNEEVAGEGWVWDYYYPGSVLDHPFVLDAHDTAYGATLRVRFYSTTLNYNTPDHHARVYLNGTLIGEELFTGRHEAIFTGAIPPGVLQDGSNTLRVESVPTLSMPNQFYLDWFEIQDRRLTRALDGQLKIDLQATGGVAAVRAGGFADPGIEVFDLTGQREILGGEVVADPRGGYQITFRDTLDRARSYCLVSSGRDPLPLQSKVFRDLRANALGADYIVITHRNFLESAIRLASHRQQSNGVRSIVVDVQDIYDEFNFGHVDARAIKDFLRMAYTTWPGAAPAYVLIFGDASWDYHHYMATTVKTNFVPSYGVPAADNWFVSFDSTHTFLPSMCVGRLPVEDPVQASRTVDKIAGYDAYVPGEWNKEFLFITGGTSPSEQASFNGMSELLIQTHIDPAPLGGSSLRVYKDTPDAIDGENKELLRSYVREGLVFMNFLGHSGGRIWGVDIGPPSELENTDGKLPFVSSVSCNVAGFAEPSANVLSEDFVLADNRGAVAMWASSSIGFANVGGTLVDYFLEATAKDTARVLGSMTTAARIRLWEARGSDYITIASVKLNPLIGDPLTQLAIPRKPDLAIPEGGVRSNAEAAASGDEELALTVKYFNYGLVPADSVEISMDDRYAGQTEHVVDRLRLPPTRHRDSLTVGWPVLARKGTHLVTATIDPASLVDEVDESNNSSTSEVYIYASGALVIRPFDNMVLAGPEVDMVVSFPHREDTTATLYEFEIDTSAQFDSPLHQASGPRLPGLYDVRWKASGLMEGLTYFWRVRRTVNGETSRWDVQSFQVSSAAPGPPRVRWSQRSPDQFRAETLVQTAAYDTGVTILKGEPVHIAARSLGYRADANKDYYSILEVDEQKMIGLWWVHGSGFLVARVAPLEGVREFRAFNTPAIPSDAGLMAGYLASAGTGDYLALSVVLDGATNVSDTLRAAIRGLGSVYIDSLRPGHSWMLIARKGFGTDFLRERWSPDGVAEDSLEAPSSYALGSGFVRTAMLAVPSTWYSFGWEPLHEPGSTSIQAAVEGVRAGGVIDTLRMIGPDETEVDLSMLNAVTGSDSTLQGISLSASLSTGDVAKTPVLRRWSLEVELPADLAVAASIPISVTDEAPPQKISSIPLDIRVGNIGYRSSDSAEVQVSVVGGIQGAPILRLGLGPLGVDSATSLHAAIPTAGTSGKVSFAVTVFPTGRDYAAANNTSVVTLDLQGSSARLEIFADGIRLMNGDYVALSPKILVQLPREEGGVVPASEVALFVDDNLSESWPAGAAVQQEDPEFHPTLSSGSHRLRVIAVGEDLLGQPDTLQEEVTVSVDAEYRIMNLFNYPNPFSSTTEFTFVLAGASAPERALVRVYTVAGRKIKTIELPPGGAEIGFNRIAWDGRDDQGDEIANGTYLYQLEIRAAEKTETATGKLARIR